MPAGVEIRRATHDDYEAVRAFTKTLWEDRGGDYIPRVYHEWLEGEDETHRKTFLAEVNGDVAGIVQAVLLSADEAWFQGMRVDPDYQRQGVSSYLNEACFEWARERGATVGRVMIFSWNAASLGAARAGGFEPTAEFRFVHPEPDSDASGPDAVSSNPATAWRYWTHSDARERLSGLGLALDEAWALRELTREDFLRFADETAVFAVERERGTAGTAYRSRTYERETGDEESETWAEYGVSAWDDVDAARSLFGAIARDAAALGADQTRVLLPETAEYVSDASYVGAEISEEPDFVLSVDFTNTT